MIDPLGQLQISRREALLSLLPIVAASATQPGCSPQKHAAEKSGPRPLRILFFNTHLLPGIAQHFDSHRGQDDYRTETIAREVSDRSIIGLCEVFESQRRQRIIDIVRQTSGAAVYTAESPKPTAKHVVGGGLLLMSRFPIEGPPNVLTYRDASQFWQYGLQADGFAAKGVIHARLRVSDQPLVLVECFLTHLECMSSVARKSQIQELAGFIAEHSSAERPLILLGDFNVAADYPIDQGKTDSEYHRLLNALRYGDGPLVDVWPSLEKGRGGTRDALAGETSARIDYIFMSPASKGAASLTPTKVKVLPFRDKQVREGSLSDHAGVECEAVLKLP
jgi:endonuclease/exonuclease/phosphatase family metal-dependent hydrolase